MIQMCRLVDRTNHIPVDEWDTEKYPIYESLRIFKNIRGEIILPIAELYFNSDPRMQSLDYFAMNAKRSYNSDETREHICRYLNYFEAYYDRDKELLAVLYQIKYHIDFVPNYTIDMFMDDVNRYIIMNPAIAYKVCHFVSDNYLMRLSSNNNRTPNLQFTNEHAKILYEISLTMNMYIPLATHYMYVHNIKQSSQIQQFMLALFDMCSIKYEEIWGIYIYDKLYETALSVVNKSKNPDKQLWEKNLVRGNNTTTHTKDSVNDVILQIMPKYTYNNNIINFNYFSNRQCLRFKITDIQYEYQLCKLSSSKRDADQNSEYDRYEARLNKKDEGLALQNKVTAEQAVKRITMPYYITNREIEHYRRSLTKDGAQVINRFQHKLINYLFDKEFGDPITMNSVHSNIDYIKMMIAAKRMLQDSGFVLLQYIISSRITRVATRKVVSKRDIESIEADPQYPQVVEKYQNPNISNEIMEIVGDIVASTFEIIDCDDNGRPTEYDGKQVPIVVDIIKSEVIKFILII